MKKEKFSWLLCLLISGFCGCQSVDTSTSSKLNLTQNLRDIVQHSQLEDYEYVAKKLGISIREGPVEALTNPVTHDYQGEAITFNADSSVSARYSIDPQDFEYGVSRKAGSKKYRGLISMRKLGPGSCIDRTSIFEAFGPSRALPSPDAKARIYRYFLKEAESYELNVIFDSDKENCATSFSLFQNRFE
jgi:hypothetical protein